MAIQSSTFLKIKQILWKEITTEMRTRSSLGTLLMFSLTTLAAVSMSIGSQRLAPEFLSVLFWIILFFSSMAGLPRVFLQESDAGTLLTLRLYASSQAVFFGKFFYNLLLLLILVLFLLPLFLIFLNADIYAPGMLCLLLLLGIIGLAAATTLIAALITQVQNQGTLFTILSFPILLPLLLLCIQLTTEALLPGAEVTRNRLLFLASYDLVLLGIASILFDYLWYD